MTLKLLQMRASAACKHPTEKLMRGGFGGGATPPTGGLGRVDSFKLSTADFESINLTEDSQVYLSLTKRVSHNN